MRTKDACPACGSTEVSLIEKTGELRCHYCRNIFKPKSHEEFTFEEDKIHEGAQDIQEEAEKVITMKCQGCGAEVSLNLEETTGARCHWCRSNLSVNNAVASGAVPDVILPFNLEKQEAKDLIENFTNRRKFFAHPTFIKEFTTENILGVYFPYFLIGVTGHAQLEGRGEIKTREYKEKDKTYYDADVYKVKRDYDLIVENLTIESSKDKVNIHKTDKTNNVINAIMPFDTENAVAYKSYYTKGYNIENRSLNVSGIEDKIDKQLSYISKFAIKDTLKQYNRGVHWDKNDFKKESQEIKAAYFPVWLYSYLDKNKTTHYIAVNARTKETMGSVPINMPKLIGVSAIIELIALVIFRNLFWYMVFVDDDGSSWPLLLLLSGFIFFAVSYTKYRNWNMVHGYEEETTIRVDNLVEEDEYSNKLKRLSKSEIKDRNDNTREIDDINQNNPLYLLNKLGDIKDVKNITNIVEKINKK